MSQSPLAEALSAFHTTRHTLLQGTVQMSKQSQHLRTSRASWYGSPSYLIVTGQQLARSANSLHQVTNTELCRVLQSIGFHTDSTLHQNGLSSASCVHHQALSDDGERMRDIAVLQQRVRLSQWSGVAISTLV